MLPSWAGHDAPEWGPLSFFLAYASPKHIFSDLLGPRYHLQSKGEARYNRAAAGGGEPMLA